MKTLNSEKINAVNGIRLEPETSFNFRCHPGLECFNRCCRNLNLFLYPYDVVRLRRALAMDSEQFLDTYADVVMRPDNFFPDVLLKMGSNPEKTCPFLTGSGCAVYPDRPDTCRTFPVELGLMFDRNGNYSRVAFFRPPAFCLGPGSTTTFTLNQWIKDQQATIFNQMTAKWAAVRGLFSKDPWQGGQQDPRFKMAFMAAYNIDRFRQFIFESSFLKRYRIKGKLKQRLKTSDKALLEFGFAWIKLMVWGIKSPKLGLG